MGNTDFAFFVDGLRNLARILLIWSKERGFAGYLRIDPILNADTKYDET